MGVQDVIAYAGLAAVIVGAIVGLIKLPETLRKTRADRDALRTGGQNQLIDQLQEELARYRTADATRMAALDARLLVLERSGAAWRQYVYELRSHIYDQLPPPPPGWPDGLDR